MSDDTSAGGHGTGAHGTGRHGAVDAQVHAAAVLHRSVVMAAGATVLLALTASLWGPVVLGSLNIPTGSEQDAIQSREATQMLERRVGGLDQGMTLATAGAARMQADVARVSRTAEQVNASEASLAITELGTALRQPGGFQQQLALARAAVKTSPEFNDLVRQIEPYGETGVPGRQRLLREFDRMHAAIAPSGAELTAVERLRRAIGRAATDDAAGQALVEVRRRLRDDDLPGAIAAARAIPDPRPEWLNQWLDDAVARVAADTLISRVEKLGEARGRDGRS